MAVLQQRADIRLVGESRFQPPLLEKVPAPDAAHSILAIENVVCAAILSQNRIDAGRRLVPATCLLATAQ